MGIMQVDLPQPPFRQQWLWDRVTKWQGLPTNIAVEPAEVPVEAWGFSAVPELSTLVQGAQQTRDGRADDAGVFCQVPAPAC